MEIKVDTKHDTHDDIRKVIKMLQHIVGDDMPSSSQPALSQDLNQNSNGSGQILSNSGQSMPSDFSEMFTNSSSVAAAEESASQVIMPAAPEMVPMPKEEKSETDDLFAELFSDEELKKMEPEPNHEAEEERNQKSPYNIEIY